MRSEDKAYAQQGTGTRTLELLEAAERYNRWLFSWLEPSLGHDNCEIGAGQGTLTRFALERGRVLATEPSDTGRAELRARFGEHPHLSGIEPDFFGVEGEARFDAIYSANVLEHIADDVAVLAHAARLLRPGGRFVAVIPAGGWLYSHFDGLVGHYRRYDRSDRLRLMVMLSERQIPLRLTTFRYRNPVGALGWLVTMRIGGRRALPANQVRTVERLVPWLRPLDNLPIPFGQSLVLGLERQ